MRTNFDKIREVANMLDKVQESVDESKDKSSGDLYDARCLLQDIIEDYQEVIENK
jgi:uncharacterized membrane-anchored protein YhcB (DUF1043 family)